MPNKGQITAAGKSGMKALLNTKDNINCINCVGCTNCTNCTNCSGCVGCSDCEYCTDQKNQQYMVANVQLTHGEYTSYQNK